MKPIIKDRMYERNKINTLKVSSGFIRNMFCFLMAMVFCLAVFGGPADSTFKTKRYHINYPVTSVIIAGGMVSDYFAISRIKGKAGISDEELTFLNSDAQRAIINSIDRWALRQNPSNRNMYKKISDYGMIGIILLPGLLGLNDNIRKDWFDLLLMYTEGHIVTFTFYNYSFLGPTFQSRYRPMTYYTDYFKGDDRDELKSGNNRNSFYSGHVATCAYSTFFMAKVYCDYHPDLGASKYLLYLAASVPPILMGWARVKALDHFPSDDAVGFLLGSVIGIVIPELHRNRDNKNLSFSMFTSPNGMGLSLHWNLHEHQLLPFGQVYF
ncbi:MAG: phosphatase PAP2 family protein [Bacteroidia bacterium]|nr:phosphatase PAP2 family protein [Bacteroidia bacterium]